MQDYIDWEYEDLLDLKRDLAERKFYCPECHVWGRHHECCPEDTDEVSTDAALYDDDAA